MTIIDGVLLALLGTIAAAEVFGAVITYRRWREARSQRPVMRYDVKGDHLGEAIRETLQKHIKQGRR